MSVESVTRTAPPVTPDLSSAGGGGPRDRSRVAFALYGLGAAGLLLALFGQRLLELARVWLDDPNYSHGFLVPLVSGYLAYQYVRRVGGSDKGNVPAGLVWLTGGCWLHLAAVLLWWPPIDFVALVTILHGLAILMGGREWARGLRFPILFLFFLFPLPVVLTERLAITLQDVVAGLSTRVLALFLPAHRDGYKILVPGAQLEVGEACSGLRQLMAFVALTLIVVHLSRRSRLFKGLLLVSAPLVAVVSNLLRVLLMAFITLNFGGRWISPKENVIPGVGFSYHDAWGLLTMGVGLLLLLGIAWWLGRVLRETGDKETGTGNRDLPARSASDGPASWSPGRLGLACAVLAVTLAGQAALLAHLHNGKLVEPPELRQPLASVPVSLGEWSGQDIPPATLPLLSRDYFERADDKLNRVYVLPLADGPPLACRLWMIHNRDGNDRNHHPYICYKVAGKVEDRGEYREVAVADQKEPIRRFCFTGEGRASYVFYWHYTLEPSNAPDASALQRIHQRLSQRLPSVTVEVFTEAGDEAAHQRLAAFVRLVDQEMRRRLPAGTRMGSDILPIRLLGEPRQGTTR